MERKPLNSNGSPDVTDRVVNLCGSRGARVWSTFRNSTEPLESEAQSDRGSYLALVKTAGLEQAIGRTMIPAVWSSAGRCRSNGSEVFSASCSHPRNNSSASDIPWPASLWRCFRLDEREPLMRQIAMRQQ
ncbi:hypothetical protein BIW11_03084 [Tropilaelaps mercedesae]|uniref:Uncharacterized protein n=1 Tax=Tropilaelaps mercedesae TaxID=418985 RepID=A0A1V9XSB6_9ACAR|nr:hypothetical protein BIW11_03084 [Tropilaelaps mercedesae]